ncbi:MULTISPECIES: DUF551 domain-containing protein [unclassified Rhizobium]|uniref:DUF551 domain-containing protein n=1 Tax=unclassified Rhizobium TaxID=2613769 RepID=UPI001ADB2E66|nr:MULTISPECIES: DUF551 domain-containing protein [unclassified Rhizobium]MBO9099482.1 DUF551 domain-containing protein [Rhizobium sp. L58/93]QXZ87036.1 DUF551 domain-containing protein [Rhizobium sp. K1/93]QXZ92930.1 DUF551 domain-containing protein [Rhizobium sp. K15/93]
MCEIAERNGYEKAVQEIDQKTGGDGEYRYCLGMEDSDRHTPDAPAMIQRIVDRFEILNLLDEATKTGSDQPDDSPLSNLSGWQDIATAPQNIKVLAAYQNDHGNWRIVTACYHTRLDWSDEYGDHEEEFAPEAWYEENDSSEVIYPTSRTPTHWMPLPTAPGASKDSPVSSSGGEPDYCYDPSEWEFTCNWDDRDQVHGWGDALEPGEPMRVATLFAGPDKWVADVPITWDTDGNPDDRETKWFDSEAEARAALSATATEAKP